MNPLERTYLDCQCDDIDHVIRFTYDPDNGDLTAEMHVVHYLPWYKRLWIGIKYVFDLDRPQYDLAMVRPADYDKLIGLVNRAKYNQKVK